MMLLSEIMGLVSQDANRGHGSDNVSLCSNGAVSSWHVPGKETALNKHPLHHPEPISLHHLAFIFGSFRPAQLADE